MTPNPHFTQAPDQQTELSASGAAATRHPAPPGPREVVAQFFAALNAEDYRQLEGLIAADAVEHDPAPGQQAGPLGYQELFGDLRRALPDLHIAATHETVAGDEVAVAYAMTGTHTGRPYRDKSADGAGIDVHGVLIARVQDGKIVERWGASDELTMRRQLGVGD